MFVVSLMMDDVFVVSFLYIVGESSFRMRYKIRSCVDVLRIVMVV